MQRHRHIECVWCKIWLDEISKQPILNKKRFCVFAVLVAMIWTSVVFVLSTPYRNINNVFISKSKQLGLGLVFWHSKSL